MEGSGHSALALDAPKILVCRAELEALHVSELPALLGETNPTQEPSRDQGELVFHSPNSRTPEVELELLHHPTRQLWAGFELGEQVRGNCSPGEFLSLCTKLSSKLSSELCCS